MMTHQTIDVNDGWWRRLRDFPVGCEGADWAADFVAARSGAVSQRCD